MIHRFFKNCRAALGRLGRGNLSKVQKSQIKVLSREIDSAYYSAQIQMLEQVPPKDPARHYLETGALSGLDPAPWFSTRFYLESHADVRAAKVNPFWHYIVNGMREGRAIAPPRDRAVTTAGGKPTLAPSRRSAILILGMHRSGTSVVTRMVGLMGATLPKDPLPPNSGNEEGYWESATLVDIHEELLKAVDSSWFDPLPLSLRTLGPDPLRDWKKRISSAIVDVYAQSNCFVVKDPRLCRMVPLYRETLTSMGIDVRVVLVSRHASEVAGSLQRRDLISANLAGVLWARHMRDAERETRNLPRAMVTYSELMRDWRPAAARLSSACPCLSAADESGIDAAFRPDLRHHRRGIPPGSDADLYAHLESLEKALDLLRLRDGAPEWREIDTIGSQIDAWTSIHADALADEYFRRRNLPAPLDWGRDELLAS